MELSTSRSKDDHQRLVEGRKKIKQENGGRERVGNPRSRPKGLRLRLYCVVCEKRA